MNGFALEAIELSKWFEREQARGWPLFRLRRPPVSPRRAVDKVSFCVRRGEIYGVLGANGSGKSTLIRIISTLLLPDEGRVAIFGHDAVREPMAVRRLINRVSADPSFFRIMSAAENLRFFGRIYGLSAHEIRERVPRVLARLGIEPDKLDEPLTNLSRGQQQKVAVARAFLSAPVLVLLDEPTTGLDPRSKRDVQAFIREVRDQHDATVLLTTHDMEEAELLCDRVAFLAGGRIVAEGTPTELRRRVAERLGRELSAVTMETVFMEITGRSIEEDETEDGAQPPAAVRTRDDHQSPNGTDRRPSGERADTVRGG
jgi:ABC-2 type transport system ATP-binding protein